jgi:hypothetical protein
MKDSHILLAGMLLQGSVWVFEDFWAQKQPILCLNVANFGASDEGLRPEVYPVLHRYEEESSSVGVLQQLSWVPETGPQLSYPQL